MSGAVLDPRLQAARKAPRKRFQFSWADPRFRNLIWQIVIVGIVVAIGWYLVSNTRANLAQRHIATGFDFLDRPAGIPIGDSLLDFTPSVSTYGRGIVIGILNTLKVAVVGVVLATIWGTLIGIARLSNNWLLAKLAALYVEVVRDIPLLLQLFFWYGMLQALPGVRQSLHPLPGFALNNRGLQVPWFHIRDAFLWVVLALVIGVVLSWVMARWATQVQYRSGRRPRTWPFTLGLVVAFPLAVWVALGAPFTPDLPTMKGFSYVGGGNISVNYATLLVGLVVYTASYIAEIVRSGILAVPTGQWEAAGALGLRRGQVLRQIVLPQAMRVIIPPMTSQYLNLTKNSSLAVAVGYFDVVSIAYTTLNQTGQAIEGMALIMGTYLTISLSISMFMNWYNARIALVER